MPQAAKKDPVSLQRAQDKEAKRARGALSCAECRRLKLKCDKTVPCSSCKRRGCSAICPNGSLITGQGTRFVLADTEKLHAKISRMSDRIRQLEDALAISHSASSVGGSSSGPAETHPLLHRDLLQIKSSIDLHAAVDGEGPIGSGKQPQMLDEAEPEAEDDEQYIDAFGTLAIREDGAATFYGRSAGTESLLIGEVSSPKETSPPPDTWPAGASNMALPHSVTQLSQSFPFNPPLNSVFPEQTLIDLEAMTNTYLPEWSEARNLAALYLEQAPWFFGAVTKRQIEEELLPMWYPEAKEALEQQWIRPAPQAHPGSRLLNAAAVPSPPGVAYTNSTASTSSQPENSPSPPSTSSQGRSATSQTPTSHDLALLFIIFTFGALTDISLPAAPDNLPAARFYELTKAALSLEGVLERPPSVATVQCLSLMAIYEGLSGGSSASHALLTNTPKKESEGNGGIESTWAIFGLAVKLAQSIGLHRDCARWKLTPAEVQKRRALFWELFITDCWQSLATGRLATFSLPFVDCELPMDPDQTFAEDGSVVPSFPYWKARFGAECVSAVVQGTLTSRAPKYSIILELDRKVRDMEVPAYTLGPTPKGEGLSKTMSHFMPINYRELTLLYIHRCFFAHALSSHPHDPIKSQYAPSFLAGYRSACTILGSIKEQFSLFPAQIARFWVLWTHAFSASVMLASVVTHSSQSKVAPAALLELRTATELFQQAASFGGRAVKFLPIVQRLHTKAHQTYLETNSGIPPAIPNDIFKPTPRDDQKDELSIFSGKTHTVVTTKPSTAAPSASSSPRDPSGSPASVNASYSPGQNQQQQQAQVQNLVAANPSFAGWHPSLVRELGGFDGHISEQIRNAYQQQQQQSNVEAAERAREMQAQMEMRERERQQQERQEYERQMQMQVDQQHRQEQYQRQQQQLEQQRLLLQRQQQQQQQQHARAPSGRHPSQEQPHQYQDPRQQQPQQNVYPVVQQQPGYVPAHEAQQGAYAAPSTSGQHYDQRPHQLHASSSRSSLRKLSHQASQSSLRHVQHAQSHPHPQAMPPPQLPRKQSQPQLHQLQPTSYTPPSTSSYSSGMQTPVSATNTDFPDSVYGGSQQQQSPVHPQHLQHPDYQPGHQSQYQMHQSMSTPAPNYHNQHVPQGDPGQPMQIEQQQYWASVSYSNPAQLAARGQQYQHHYTPEAALRGIAADDNSLQETWTSYMSNVGSPRAIFDN